MYVRIVCADDDSKSWAVYFGPRLRYPAVAVVGHGPMEIGQKSLESKLL